MVFFVVLWWVGIGMQKHEKAFRVNEFEFCILGSKDVGKGNKPTKHTGITHHNNQIK